MSLGSIRLLGGLILISVCASYLMYGNTFGVKLRIKTKFKEALLDLSKDDFWEEKWKKLSTGEIHGVNLSLTKAKSDWKIETMKNACKEIYEQPFEGIKSNNFLNFRAYCALTNGDKLSKISEFKANKAECEKIKDELYLSEIEFKKFKIDCSAS